MKIKNRIVRYFLFFVVLLIADRIIGAGISYLARKQVRDDRIGMLIENKINAQIFILGSSRALNNYGPEIISSITGKSCYNLGVSGSSILFHETLLDLIVSGDNKPELIVYNIDDYGTLFKIDGIVYRKDVLFPFVHNNYVNRNVSREMNRHEIATQVSATYRQNVNFINALKYLANGREAADYKTTNFDSLGANLLIQRPEDNIPVFGARNIQLPSHTPDTTFLASFKRIQEKCLRSNIKLILSLPPLYTEPSAFFRKLIKQHALTGVYWLDFTKQMQQPEFFFNTDHMNREGAIVFSEKVGTELNKIIQ